MAGKFGLFASFWLYPILAGILFLWARADEPSRAPLDYILWVLSGGLLWTLVEYGMHRFVFHSAPSSPRLARIVHGLHLDHHHDPRDARKILVRPQTSLPLSLVILGVTYWGTGSPVEAAGIMTGVWAGFLYYEWVHYRVHTSSSVRRGMDGQRRRHFHHHFIDDRKRFGVTSPFWDWVFRT